MTPDRDAHDELGAGLDALVGRAEVWFDVPPGLEDAVVAEISALAAQARTGDGTDASRGGRRWGRALALAAAVVGGLALGTVLVARRGGDDGVVVALSGTELAPDASATAEVEDTPAGVRIVLDVDGLEGALPGTYYEAWVRTDAGIVSAGTFHLRGSDDPIELWCGIESAGYSRMTVTVQSEGGGAESSGRVVLEGSFPG